MNFQRVCGQALCGEAPINEEDYRDEAHQRDCGPEIPDQASELAVKRSQDSLIAFVIELPT
jgi:hypothetical protein